MQSVWHAGCALMLGFPGLALLGRLAVLLHLTPSSSLAAEVEAALALVKPGTPAGSCSPVRRQPDSSSDIAAVPAGEVHLSEMVPVPPGGVGPSAHSLRNRQGHGEAPS